MTYDRATKLWPTDSDRFFRDRVLRPVRQAGPHCVSTVLAILTGEAPEHFQERINTQDPVSWSEALRPFGMKLAYCPTDVRRLRHYIPELLALDDLFTLSYFTAVDPEEILGDPNDDGWVCGSHIVVLHRDSIIDPLTGARTKAGRFAGSDCHTKRIFRVVAADHERGL